MKSILFLVLWSIPVFQAHAQGVVEIYANGKKYDSMQSYKASERSTAAQSPQAEGPLNSKQDDLIRQEARKLGINVDFSKVKTIQINQKKLSDTTVHQLFVLSVENGMVGALQDFDDTRAQSDFQVSRQITLQQLQGAIAQAVTTSNGPKLLISEPGKLRIMALTTKEKLD